MRRSGLRGSSRTRLGVDAGSNYTVSRSSTSFRSDPNFPADSTRFYKRRRVQLRAGDEAGAFVQPFFRRKPLARRPSSCLVRHLHEAASEPYNAKAPVPHMLRHERLRSQRNAFLLFLGAIFVLVVAALPIAVVSLSGGRIAPQVLQSLERNP